ncbi:hypothetical protein D3C76_1572130 [compost metagenome]
MASCRASDGSAIAYPLARLAQRAVHGGFDVSHDVLSIDLDGRPQPGVSRPSRDIWVLAEEVGAITFVGDTPVAITGPLASGITLGAVFDEAQVKEPPVVALATDADLGI